MIQKGKNGSIRVKPAPVTLYLSQILHGLTWDWGLGRNLSTTQNEMGGSCSIYDGYDNICEYFLSENF